MNDTQTERTPETIQRLIAGILGWTDIRNNAAPHHPSFTGLVGIPPGGRASHIPVPNYAKDLNAMHEAEKYFDDKSVDAKSMYWDYLALAVAPEPFPGNDSFSRDYAMLRATAVDRAEAFIKTAGSCPPLLETGQYIRCPKCGTDDEIIEPHRENIFGLLRCGHCGNEWERL